jgi:hypothetical protein
MAKQYFKLTGYYEGLTAKRINQSGRLWLLRVVNDGPPYWLVMIRGFDPDTDRASGEFGDSPMRHKPAPSSSSSAPFIHHT